MELSEKSLQTRIRERVSRACRILAYEQHGDALLGHVSVRSSGGESFWIKAASYGLEEVTRAHILCLNLAGELLEGSGRRHQEWPIHAALYQARSDIQAVVHTHAFYSCLLSCLQVPLQPLSYEGALFVPGELAYFEQTADLIASPELGRDLALTLGSRRAVLLRNHGLVTVGTTLAEACMLAIHLERACQIFVWALQTGVSSRAMSEEEAYKKRETYQQSQLARNLWNYYSRKIVSRAAGSDVGDSAFDPGKGEHYHEFSYGNLFSSDL